LSIWLLLVEVAVDEEMGVVEAQEDLEQELVYL
jgi:hypothetical protein